VFLENMDIEKYFDDKGIVYHPEGKNVGKGYIGIQCPFCADKSNHLNIHLDYKTIKCWRCSEKGTIIKLIMKLEQCSYNKAIDKIKLYTKRELKGTQPEIRKDRSLLVPYTVPLLYEHKKYLESRGFAPDYIEECFLVSSTLPSDPLYRFRILVPVIFKKRIVSWVARDVTGVSNKRYIACANEHSLIPIKHCLYNIDTVKDVAVIVEGVTDVWNLGDGVVATFGTSYTVEQLALLRHVRRAFILFDSGAEELGERLTQDLSTFVPETKLYVLDQGDPGELCKDHVRQFRNMVFSKIY